MLISKNTPKEVVLGIGKSCDRCGNCCKFNAGYVLNEEIPRIASYLKISEEELKDKYLDETERFNKKIYKPKLLRKTKKIDNEEVELPYGKCIFYDDRFGCIIHDVKPLYCAIATCKHYSKDVLQWYDLNFVVDPHDPESIRQWATYLRFNNNDVIPGGSLIELVPDEKELSDMLNFKLINNIYLESEKLKKKLDSLIKSQKETSYIQEEGKNENSY